MQNNQFTIALGEKDTTNYCIIVITEEIGYDKLEEIKDHILNKFINTKEQEILLCKKYDNLQLFRVIFKDSNFNELIMNIRKKYNKVFCNQENENKFFLTDFNYNLKIGQKTIFNKVFIKEFGVDIEPNICIDFHK